MKLARAAAARALDAHAQAEPDPTPETGTGTGTNTQPRTPKTPDPDLTYARHASGVRQAVALEARIAAGSYARPHTGQAHAGGDTGYDPASLDRFAGVFDHSNIAEAVHHLTQDHPDRWQFHETLSEIIDDSLATYPEDPVSTHFARVCEALEIAPDLACLPQPLAALLRPPADLPEDPPDRWPKPG